MASWLPDYYDAVPWNGGGRVREIPTGNLGEQFPTEEIARAFAVRLTRWLVSRPDSGRIEPWANVELELASDAAGAHAARLDAILDRCSEPEQRAEELLRASKWREAVG